MPRSTMMVAIFCFICVSVVSSSWSKIDPETAVGVWLFDEGIGNNTKDSSGKGHDGQINGAKWENGKFGKGLEFNGRQWVRDQIDTGNFKLATN